MNELVKFDEISGDIRASGAQIYSAAIAQVQALKMELMPVISKCNNAPWDQMTDEQVAKTDDVLNKLQAKCNHTIAFMQSQRKPITRKFDEITALFTEQENLATHYKQELHRFRVLAGGQIYARNQAREKEKIDILNKNNELTEFNTSLERHLNNKLWELCNDVKNRLMKAFYETDLSMWDVMVKNLAEFDPAKELRPDHVTNWCDEFTFHFKYIEPQTKQTTFEKWQALVIKNLIPIKDELTNMIDMRRSFLEGNTQATILDYAGHVSEVNQRLEQSREQVEDEIAIQEDAALINSAMHAEATIKITKTKGSTVKKEMIPSNHEEWRKVIRFGINALFNDMSLEEVEKKFDWLLKAANKHASAKNEFPEGVPVQDKVKTRVTK